MDRRALEKAESRLRVLRRALSDLEASTSHRDFSDHWYTFLTAFKNIYTVLEQGAKSSPQSRQWFGSKATFRRGDPLLQYVYQARNDDEHGLASSINLKPMQTEIGVSRPGFSQTQILNGGPFRNVEVSGGFGSNARFTGALPADLSVTSLDNKPVLIKRTPATTILVDVSDRDRQTKYQPPTTHLGKPIADVYPLAVAELAAEYAEALLAEASKLA